MQTGKNRKSKSDFCRRLCVGMKVTCEFCVIVVILHASRHSGIIYMEVRP